jgi:hypothetical protein
MPYLSTVDFIDKADPAIERSQSRLLVSSSGLPQRPRFQPLITVVPNDGHIGYIIGDHRFKDFVFRDHFL